MSSLRQVNLGNCPRPVLSNGEMREGNKENLKTNLIRKIKRYTNMYSLGEISYINGHVDYKISLCFETIVGDT